MGIATVRTLIPDEEIYQRYVTTGDGSLTEFQTPYFPMAAEPTCYVGGVLTVPSATDLTHGLVTFAAPPGAAVEVVISYKHTMLSDAQLTTFLTVAGDSDLSAAALALDSIASNEALVLKLIELGDLKTDGPAVAKALREHAARLRDLAGSESEDFDWAEMALTPASTLERRINEALRE